MDKFKMTGGARIGMGNSTWPFATLKVTKDKLELNASIVGNLVFQPQDIISIETYTMIPFVGQGIKINHRITNYNSKVIFWTFKNPTSVVNQIKQTGFLENTDSVLSNEEIVKQQQAGGFPIKKQVVIGIVVIWNLLFLSDFLKLFQSEMKGRPTGNGVTIALAMLFFISLLSLISGDFRKLILKEGKSIDDIRKSSYFLLLVSGLMLLQDLAFNFF